MDQRFNEKVADILIRKVGMSPKFRGNFVQFMSSERLMLHDIPCEVPHAHFCKSSGFSCPPEHRGPWRKQITEINNEIGELLESIRLAARSAGVTDGAEPEELVAQA